MQPVLLLTGVTCVALLTSFVLPSERTCLIACSIAAVSALGAVLQLIRRSVPGFLTPLFFVGYQLMGAIFLLLNVAVLSEAAFFRHPLPYLLEAPRGCFVALVAPSIGFLMLAAIVRLVRGEPPMNVSLRAIADRLPVSFEPLLIIAAMLQFSLWFTTDESLSESTAAYLMRIVAKPSALIPFVAGYLALRFKRATFVWGAVFVLGIGFSFVTGNRGYAFLPMIPYLLGLFFGLKTWRARSRIGIALSPFLVAAILVGSLVGERRTVSGRFSLSKVSEIGLESIMESSVGAIQEDQRKGESETGMLESGLSRMVNWPNLAIPVMTPSVVAYRGFSDFFDEAMATLSIARFSGRAYFANLYANLYGFLVNESTSVEFGIVADGATRAGTFGAILYGFVAAAVLLSLEHLNGIVHRGHPGVMLLSAVGLSGAGAFDMVRTGLFSSARSAVLGLITLSIVFRLAALMLDPLNASPGSAGGPSLSRTHRKGIAGRWSRYTARPSGRFGLTQFASHANRDAGPFSSQSDVK